MENDVLSSCKERSFHSIQFGSDESERTWNTHLFYFDECILGASHSSFFYYHSPVPIATVSYLSAWMSIILMPSVSNLLNSNISPFSVHSWWPFLDDPCPDILKTLCFHSLVHTQPSTVEYKIELCGILRWKRLANFHVWNDIFGSSEPFDETKFIRLTTNKKKFTDV